MVILFVLNVIYFIWMEKTVKVIFPIYQKTTKIFLIKENLVPVLKSVVITLIEFQICQGHNICRSQSILTNGFRLKV